ncbi:MAG: hypothetical protein QOF83_3034 [Solirubrobacteraceae bacterium]|jgi:hypothetical protein|nr:hypothetical protein [Solirubrobacteraceae bacterium]
MWPVSTISAKPEPLELELEFVELADPPRLPDELDPPLLAAPDELALPEALEPELLDEDPAPPVTGSPGLRLSSETMVPALGDTSRVSARVVWALRKLASAPSTAA